jgi:hypothetical protein
MRQRVMTLLFSKERAAGENQTERDDIAGVID